MMFSLGVGVTTYAQVGGSSSMRRGSTLVERVVERLGYESGTQKGHWAGIITGSMPEPDEAAEGNTYWVLCSGPRENRRCALRVYDLGVKRTIAYSDHPLP